MRKKSQDLTGRPFGYYTAIRQDGCDSQGVPYWLCRCRCGNEKRVRVYDLLYGSTKSCGCLRLDRCREVCTKHGLCASHPRLTSSVREHIRFIRCDTIQPHKKYKHMMIPAKYLGNSGSIRFVQEVVIRYPEKSDEYERNKNLELDKDISGVPVFAPWNIRFVTREENQSYRRNTRKMNGIPLAKICREYGISSKSLEYKKIARVWRERGEIHPILWNARKQNLEKEERLLEMTKLRCKRAELMITAYKELLASKTDTP